jgi:hypothetical protein
MGLRVNITLTHSLRAAPGESRFAAAKYARRFARGIGISRSKMPIRLAAESDKE